MPRLSRSQLGSLHRLASGGQGVVYRAPDLNLRFASGLAFKEYKPQSLANVDGAALEEMSDHLEALPEADARTLLTLAAWPCCPVEDAGTLVGFVMPMIPDQFFVTMTTASGPNRVVGEFQHLLNDEDFLARRGIRLTDRHRYELLVAVAQALEVLHRHEVAVGDFSPKNLLFSFEPTSAVYFIDCDAMRLRGRTVGPQLETPDWDIHSISAIEELATPASDNYKFGLLALRLLAGAQATRSPGAIPAGVPPDVRDLVRLSLELDRTGTSPLSSTTVELTRSMPDRIRRRAAAGRRACFSLDRCAT